MKLKERKCELVSAKSPIPSPDYDAPSSAGWGDEMDISIDLSVDNTLCKKGRALAVYKASQELETPRTIFENFQSCS